MIEGSQDMTLKLAETYPGSTHAPEAYYSAAGNYWSMTSSLISELPDKESYFLKAIAVYEKLRAGYPAHQKSELALFNIGTAYWQIGVSIYTYHYNETGEWIIKRDYLLKGIETLKKYLADYPDGSQYAGALNYLGSIYSSLAESYKQDADFDMIKESYDAGIGCYQNYLSQVGLSLDNKRQTMDAIAIYYREISRDYLKYKQDEVNQKKYGLLAVEQYKERYNFAGLEGWKPAAAREIGNTPKEIKDHLH
ncbi:MAG: hypothetical protein PHW04_10550 [Candidatus Wallbacteria bacterium]|nr:hypothetical protein [Candidatus Wallbacteria bacterium]